MEEVMLLRHASRGPDGNLTTEGINACHELAPRLGNFDLVIASPTDRTQQTAEELTDAEPFIDSRAFDFHPNAAQQERIAAIEASPASSMEMLQNLWGIPGMAEVLRNSGNALIDLAQTTIRELQPGKRGLIVTHNVILLAMEKIYREQDFATVDHNIGPLCGFILTTEGLHDFSA